jgi:hypothetical protein
VGTSAGPAAGEGACAEAEALAHNSKTVEARRMEELMEGMTHTSACPLRGVRNRLTVSGLHAASKHCRDAAIVVAFFTLLVMMDVDTAQEQR